MNQYIGRHRAPCRTCGFTDCDSPDLGYCPRWQTGPEGLSTEDALRIIKDAAPDLLFCGCGHAHPAGASFCYLCDLPLSTAQMLEASTDDAVRKILGA